MGTPPRIPSPAHGEETVRVLRLADALLAEEASFQDVKAVLTSAMAAASRSENEGHQYHSRIL